MATYTSYYNMTKPTMAESADIRVINGNMDTVDEIMHSTQVSMADAFDSTATYAIRDLVMYEFQLYQCIHPHTGAWDARNWTRVNAAETGGNYVEITPTYQSGLKIAETNIDGDTDEIDVPYMGGATSSAAGSGGAVPAPAAGDQEKFLCGNGRWEIPSGGGGGGTTVVPNPVGEPTDDLDTVQIGNTIYNIPGSGGGGNGNGKADLVYRAVDTSFVDIAFDISKYDLYIINASDSLYQSGETYTVTREALKYYMDNSIIFCGWPYSTTSSALIQYLVTANGFEADDHAQGFVITSIYGINTGTILAPMIYSEDEREVGCWIDNKPLYQKTFDLTNVTLSDNNWNNDILGTAGSGISIKNLEGYFGLSGYYATGFKYEYYRNNAEFFTVNIAGTNGDTLNARPNMNAGVSVMAGIVTIWYTKDADTAGSGNYGSLGVPMVHYDSDEKVVGTYYGATLYEKTYLNNSINGTETTVQTGLSIDKLVDIEVSGYKVDGGNNKIRFTETYNDGGDRLNAQGINNNIRILCTNWFVGGIADVTIRYTKVTV